MKDTTIINEQYKYELVVKSLEEMQILAIHIAKNLKTGDILALNGNLGTGKTTFSRFIIKHLAGENTEVLSPTFSLIQPYDTKKFTIYHFDLYRIETINDVYELGIEDAFNLGVSLIEWSEIIKDILPENVIKINIDYYSENDNCRTIMITSKLRNIDFLEAT